MIKQVNVNKLSLLIDRSLSVQQVSNQLVDHGNRAKLLFVEQQTGAGYYQWSLEGDDWRPFVDFDDEMKPIIASIFEQRRTTLKEAMNNSALCEAVLTVPSENEFIFFREKDGNWEIALTAWGYRYANYVYTGREIGAWVNAPKPEPEPEPEPVIVPEPEPTPEPELEPEPEPKYVTLRLLDYGGFPMPNIPFKLKTKKMGVRDLITDENGICLVPEEWFTPKEKMRVNIVISPEYQELHELHQKKK